ncbi:hypothetical protein RchiOBHm_Chr2g0098591 [Rosa chinensis]|uniref:Uncharacterized protein n=1 Tax=Rosa chinensis TaxID=74649 RepID=A0A2P6RLN1_ROSCH|nr:hypothetical protein RchiOBHm_Chr2g0098591 [Rosa chinensis]
MTRGLQNPTPSVPFSSALVNPPPPALAQPSSSSNASDTQALNFQNTIDFLQNQNEDLHHSFETFQNRMSAQFAALQNTVVASLVQRPQPPASSISSSPQLPNSNFVSTGRPAGPFRKWSPAEQRDRRDRGLCYTCDEPYSKGHVCKKPFLAIMESPLPVLTDESPEFFDAVTALETSSTDQEDIIPLHAITDSTIGAVMRMEGLILNTPIRIFIDCGSASNFLNPAIAHRLGLPIYHDSPLQFTSASGHDLRPAGTVHNVQVQI